MQTHDPYPTPLCLRVKFQDFLPDTPPPFWGLFYFSYMPRAPIFNALQKNFFIEKVSMPSKLFYFCCGRQKIFSFTLLKKVYSIVKQTGIETPCPCSLKNLNPFPNLLIFKL